MPAVTLASRPIQGPPKIIENFSTRQQSPLAAPCGPTLEDAVSQFRAILSQAGALSPNTVKHYLHDLTLFVRYLRKHRPELVEIGSVNRAVICDFLEHLHGDRGNSPNSRRRRLAALRRFFATLCEVGWIEADPTSGIPNIEPAASRPVTLDRDECLRLLEAAKTTRFPRRDHAIFRLFLTSGCTLSELLALTRRDVDLAGRAITFLGRGGRQRTLTLSPGAHAALKSYAAVRPQAPAHTQAFFLNRRGEPITKGAVYHALRKALARARIEKPGITVHSLRHTCFTLLWQWGISLRVIQALAGHCTIATTREYETENVRDRRPRRWLWVHPLDAADDDESSAWQVERDDAEWEKFWESLLQEEAWTLN